MTRKESKAITKEVYNKHFVKGKYAPKKDDVAARVAGEPAGVKVISVIQLKSAAKVKGIKNFQLLHRDELIKVLAEATGPAEIANIIAVAVARWKSGWGKKAKKILTKVKPTLEYDESIK